MKAKDILNFFDSEISNLDDKENDLKDEISILDEEKKALEFKLKKTKNKECKDPELKDKN